MSTYNFLPVYGPDRELLYNAPLSSVPRLLESGLATAVGTRQRTRALLAATGAIDILRAMKLPTGQRYSHNHETNENPRGVWTFRHMNRNAA